MPPEPATPLPDPLRIAEDVERALAEDLGPGDATADLIPPGILAEAELWLRESAVLCGIPWFEGCFRALDPEVRFDWQVREGERLAGEALLGTIAGEARALVAAERSALNFLQTLSGTATTVDAWMKALAGFPIQLLDTRKTIPGLRHAQKYAVRVGGAGNHRMGLYDAMLIKENHIAAAGGLKAAVRRAREAHPELPLQVEVESLAELAEALAEGVESVLLDDFDEDAIRAAVRMARGRATLEVSGGITLERARRLAELGIDRVSAGALTKHLRAIDFSLRFR
jgi:nicotinate-nucleotide pyrophosphorylase (carboxylating)